jgi:glycosyltransferase involved in cell wall biosynthesis
MTFNEERNIRRCLESVRWCDEIIVIDSFSTDTTVDICKEYTEQVFQEEWKGYIGQRNALRKKANFDWILFLDADEEISPALQDEIVHCFKSKLDIYVGYEFPRQVFYLGRWIKHGEWNPDVKLRLFKKDRGRSGGREPHDMVIVDGPVKRLKGKIWHYTYTGIQQQIETMNRFTSISAKEMYKSGRSFRWSDLMFRPAFRLFKALILKAGLLDGRRGFIIATISATGVAMKYAKLWELHRDHADDERKLDAARQKRTKA